MDRAIRSICFIPNFSVKNWILKEKKQKKLLQRKLKIKEEEIIVIKLF